MMPMVTGFGVGKAYDGESTKRKYSQAKWGNAKVCPIHPVGNELRDGMENTAGGALP
jgi:hypothetical protein